MYRSVALTIALGIAVCGVCLFCCGFLLQRQAIEERSECSDKSNFYRSTDESLRSLHCWYPAKFKKAVIILIDALKFEFTLYGPPWDENEHYRNKMPVFSELFAQTGGEQTALLKFLADAPTTTVQRLKALMTGGLPTFIDAGTNFYQTEVREDNLVNQMFRMGKKAVFMGDDAWVNLFPGKFTRAFAYPSFVVKDLHTVDNGVLEHLYPELDSEGSWDVLVAHFLGVDHCGHWLGRNHPAMAAKLKQLDQVIRLVASKLREDTLLVVMSDHGMTIDGDHGGETEDEVEAVLFLHAKKPFLSAESNMTAMEHRRSFPTVAQVDLVPTLALLLDLPIPYSSLGSLIPEAFPGLTAKHAKPQELLPLWLNVQQVARYLGQVPNSPLHPEQRLQELRQLWDQCLDNPPSAEAATKAFVNGSLVFLKDARHAAHEVWATFDIPRMYTGLAMAVLGSLLLVYLCCKEHEDTGVLDILKSPTGPCVVCWLLMPFSNSFAVAEHMVVLYLFQTLLASSILFKGPVTLSTSRSRALALCVAGILAATRLSAVFWRCREEHLGRPCDESLLLKSPSELQSRGLERVLGACGCALLLACAAWPARGAARLTSALAQTGLLAATGALLAHWLVQLKPPATVQGLLGSHQELLPNTAMVASLALMVLGTLLPPAQPGHGVSLLPAATLLFLFTLAGESYVPPLCLEAAALWGLIKLWSWLPPTDVWGPVLSWLLLGQLGFFGTGHQTSFSTIHWKAAFVGAPIDQPPLTLGACKVLLNTFAGPLVAAVSLPLVGNMFSLELPCCARRPFLPFLAYCVLLLLQVCSTMASCLLLRRHLMVWTVFAPRLVFQVLSAFVSIAAVLIGWAISRRTGPKTRVFHID